MAEPSHWDRVVELARISMENPVVTADQLPGHPLVQPKETP
jgi:hypothetical protein